jgi:integrase
MSQSQWRSRRCAARCNAIAHGKVKRNPAQDFRPSDILKATRKTNYARIDEKDLPHLLKEIEVYRGTPLTRLALKLMALTFVRTSELIGARWSEFNLEAARWDIPADRMKMRTPHMCRSLDSLWKYSIYFAN